MERRLDMRGTLCPEPVLGAHRELRQMALGERLTLLADDPVAEIDITHFCRSRGHVLLSCRQEGKWFEFLIERG